MTSWRNIFAIGAAAWLMAGLAIVATAGNTVSNYAIRGDGTGSAYGLLTEIEVVTAGVGDPLVLTAADCGKTFTTDGITATAYVTLPTASAGLWVRFVDDDASDLLRVTCASGDTLSINKSVSSAAGYAQSGSAAGESSVTLLAVDNTRWISTSVRNGWDVYDGALNAATGLHAGYYFSSPSATANETNTPIKCAGTTTATVTGRGFTHTDNKLVYDGIATKDFLVSATVSFAAAAATTAKLHIYRSGSLVTGSTVNRVLANNAEGAWAISVTASASTDQYFELWCETNDGDDITITAGTFHVVGVSSN